MSYGTLDVITLSGYSKGGRMTPQQRRFRAAARRCRGDAACMSRALGGTSRRRSGRKRGGGKRRRGLGILPHSSVAGTECIRYKTGPSGLRRCAEFGYNPEFHGTGSYQYTRGGKKVGKPGKKYKKGMWKAVYKRKGRSWPGGGTKGMECQAYKAKRGDKCVPRCAWYGSGPRPKGAYKNPDTAKAKCRGK